MTCMVLVGRNNLVTGSTDTTIRLWRAGAKEQGSSSPSYTLHVSLIHVIFAQADEGLLEPKGLYMRR